MKKIGNSFKGILGGLIALLIGICLLWWNEGNNVKNLKTTAEMEKIVIDIKSDSVDSNNEGKLVATNGKLINEEELTDENFGVTVKTPILKRIVEVYQWEEDSHTNDNDVTTYTYDKKWSSDLIDSSNFHNAGHNNPAQKLYDDKTFTSSNVKLNAFTLSNDQVNNLSTKEKFINFNQEKINSLNLTVSNNYITNSKDLNNPEIGDERISFVYNNSTDISVLAVQTGNTFTSYVSSTGKTVSRIMDGTHSGAEMIENIKKENNFLKWMFRFIGILLLVIGFGSILGPISAISSFVPILGNIVGTAVGLVSFLLGLSLGLVIIAIAWIRFRPLLGIGLLAIAIGLIYLIIKKGKQETKSDSMQPNSDINKAEQSTENIEQPSQNQDNNQ